jgi:iron(III) transport system permease protein
MSQTVRVRQGLGSTTTRPWSRVSRALTAKRLVIGGSIVILGYLAIVPLTLLLYEAFTDDSGFTFGNYLEAYSATGLLEMIRNSILFALGSTILTFCIGATLAYAVIRTDIPFRGLVYAVSLVPLVIPGILYTIAWILLAGPRAGLLNDWMISAVGVSPFNVYGLWGMIWIEGTSSSPLTFLLMLAAFRSMDPALEESARVSGAKMSKVIRMITLPLLKPAVAASILIQLVRALESFETPLLVGLPGGVLVFTTRIWRELSGFPPRTGTAAAYAVGLLAICALGVYFYDRLSKRRKAFVTVVGKGFRSHVRPLSPRARLVTGTLILCYFGVTVVLPLAVLVWVSLLPSLRLPSVDALQFLSFENYRLAAGAPLVVRGARNSLLLAVFSATITMFLTAVAAWVVVRTRARGRWIVDNLAFMPMVFPGLVLGVALLFVYLRVPLPIYGTLLILVVAYVTKYMPYGIRYASASMYQISAELEESASVAGAKWWQVFRKIDLPLLLPGLISGWTYIALLSARELSSSILLYSPGREVIAVTIWQLWDEARIGELAALGVMLVAALLLLVMLARAVGGKFGVASGT